MNDFARLVIDGNDGTGKTTMCGLLRPLGHRVVDRGDITYAVDHGLPPANPGDRYVVLDAPPELCRARLLAAGKGDDRYHSVESLAYYAPRYLEVAKEAGATIVDSSGSVGATLDALRRAVGDILPSTWRAGGEEFQRLPLIAKGESKEVRSVGAGRVLIRLRPTLYSYTANRYAEVPGTAELRAAAAAKIASWLNDEGIGHAILESGGEFVLASEVVSRPPIETIVKAFHVGTPTHRYLGMMEAGCPYQRPIVRFDWMNPLRHPVSGERMADEPLPDDLAAFWYPEIAEAKKSALDAWGVISGRLADAEMTFVDGCFLLGSGLSHYGEISPDSMRVTHLGQHLDKQLWRGGMEPAALLAAWEEFCRRIGV